MTDAFVSIVVPFQNASVYAEQALAELDALARRLFPHHEIVVVDDASTDATAECVQRLQQTLENVQLYVLNRRSGLDVALVAGIDSSIGDFVITLNPQTDPLSLLADLWASAQAGHEVVCGVRTDRLQGGFRGRANALFYRVFKASTGLTVPPGVSDLRLYSRRVVNYITQNNDRHLLLKVLPFFVTRRIGTVEYRSIRRGAARERTVMTAILSASTILLSSSIRPLRLMTLMALVASSLSLLFALYVVAIALFKTHVVEGWISLALPMAVMFFFVSTILGILSEYIYMVSQQSGNRPMYSIAHESLSTVLSIDRALNVVDRDGFAARSAAVKAVELPGAMSPASDRRRVPPPAE